MVSGNNSNGKKNLDFDVNVLPVIDVLSVCIIFLLLTTVWIHVGTMNISQAIGEAQNENKKNPPTVTATLEETGDVVLKIDNLEQQRPEFDNIRIEGSAQGINKDAILDYAKTLNAQVPEIQTVNILPKAKSSYKDIILVMDQFKKGNIRNVGVSPL